MNQNWLAPKPQEKALDCGAYFEYPRRQLQVKEKAEDLEVCANLIPEFRLTTLFETTFTTTDVFFSALPYLVIYASLCLAAAHVHH